VSTGCSGLPSDRLELLAFEAELAGLPDSLIRVYPLPKPLRHAARVLTLILTTLAPACDDDGGDIQEPGPGAVAEVVVAAPTTTAAVGQSVQFTATARDASGHVLEGGTFAWTTADASVATVSETGLVTAVAEGQAAISATEDGITGSLAVAVLPPAPPPPEPTPGLQEIASGLAFPLYLTSPPDDDRLFIVEKGGTIRVIKGGVLLGNPFLDLSGRVSAGPEQGLLGLAFAPDYVSSGRFVVHYTDRDGDTRVSLFRVSDDPDRADPASESVVLTTEQPGPTHNGGQILFGPDGLLYIGLGDGGSRDGEDGGRGQSLDDLLGSVLRIDVSSGSGYIVPLDNPFVGTAGARGEIWSYGLRNPWRFSFDRGTGDLYIADVGESRWEEVNRATAAEGAGRSVNYGWSRMEGSQCFVEGCDRSGLTRPLVQYDHADGCAVTGGYVYRGAAISGLQGQYFYGDYCEGWVRSFRAEGDPGQPVDWPALSPGDNITSFGEDAAGELYIVTQGGGVFKIVPQ
jgi:glucose/arabinose dehydrogenase